MSKKKLHVKLCKKGAEDTDFKFFTSAEIMLKKALKPLNLKFSQVLNLCKKGAESAEFKIFTSAEIM